MDCFYVFIFSPISFIGLLLCLFSLIILMDKKQFDIPLYGYLRLYVINSTIQCFLGIFLFIAHSATLFQFSNSFLAQYFLTHVYLPVSNTCYFYSSILDILIIIERIVTLSSYSKFKYFMKLPVELVGLFALLLCLTINLSQFFFLHPIKKSIALDTERRVDIYFMSKSNFSQTILGQILTYLQYAIREVIVLFVIIIFNIISVVLLRKQLHKKSKMLKASQNIVLTQKQVFYKSDGTIPLSLYQGVGQHRMSIKSTATTISRIDQKATIMAIIMCTLSSIEHFFILTVLVSLSFDLSFNFFVLALFCNTFIILKHGTNFFLFYITNKKFRIAYQTFSFTKKSSF
jgi:hypothetical protein